MTATPDSADSSAIICSTVACTETSSADVTSIAQQQPPCHRCPEGLRVRSSDVSRGRAAIATDASGSRTLLSRVTSALDVSVQATVLQNDRGTVPGIRRRRHSGQPDLAWFAPWPTGRSLMREVALSSNKTATRSSSIRSPTIPRAHRGDPEIARGMTTICSAARRTA